MHSTGTVEGPVAKLWRNETEVNESYSRQTTHEDVGRGLIIAENEIALIQSLESDLVVELQFDIFPCLEQVNIVPLAVIHRIVAHVDPGHPSPLLVSNPKAQFQSRIRYWKFVKIAVYAWKNFGKGWLDWE